MSIPDLRSCILFLALAMTSTVRAEPFTLAVIPDVQQEVLNANDTRLADRLQWLVDNRQALNLAMVLQVGDMLNWDTPDHIQYECASKSLTILDRAHVPYVLAIGNHDTAATKEGGSAAPGNVHDNLRNTTTFNTFFPVSRFQALQGVFETGKVDNAWHTFQAGGLDWLVINLELWPRATVVQWAGTVVENHPHHNVIVVTHSHLTARGKIEQRNGGYGDNSPQFVFDHLLKRYPNIRLVLSGHTGRHAYRLDHGEHGNAIYQFCQCYHSNDTNPVRLLEIDPRAGRIRSRVYAPSLGKDLDDGSKMEIDDVQWVSPAAAASGTHSMIRFDRDGVFSDGSNIVVTRECTSERRATSPK